MAKTLLSRCCGHCGRIILDDERVTGMRGCSFILCSTCHDTGITLEQLMKKVGWVQESAEVRESAPQMCGSCAVCHRQLFSDQACYTDQTFHYCSNCWYKRSLVTCSGCGVLQEQESCIYGKDKVCLDCYQASEINPVPIALPEVKGIEMSLNILPDGGFCFRWERKRDG